MPTTLTFEHYEVMTREDGSLCELGRGAMGITYKGFDTRLRVPVALKVINAAHLHSETARQRFVREARSAARLRHRNVASVFHLGQEGENYFYAMEFIDGETVDARVKKSGPLAPALALKIAAQVARALNAAQTHELVHRDIKPANLMLVHEDDELIVKVIDFGLAKVALGGGGEDAATLTMSGFLGTPHFASPEQLEEREIDVRSDIYSLGVTLWFSLTGKTPFAGSVLQVMSQHITRQPPFEQLENVPAPVVELLRGMLDKNPAQRPQTAIQLRREIERCLEQIGDTADDTPDIAPRQGGGATTVSEADETQFETGAAIGTRFIVSEQIGETEAGRVFRARDNAENREVRLLALDRDLTADTEAVAQIEADAKKLVALAHPNVLGVYGITNDGRSAYLTLEWIDGFSLRDLLRVRRELSLGEVLQLLPQAASGVDAAESVQCERLAVTLPQLSVNFPACEIAPEILLRRAIAEWPDFQVKFNALPISRDRFSLTWDGAQTIVGQKGAGSESDGRVVQEFGAVVYEMLGGAPASVGPNRYTPLASIGEKENEVLRRAILQPQSFASASDFVDALAAPAERVESAPVRATAAATTTPESPATEFRVEEKIAPPVTPAAVPIPVPEMEQTAVVDSMPPIVEKTADEVSSPELVAVETALVQAREAEVPAPEEAPVVPKAEELREREPVGISEREGEAPAEPAPVAETGARLGGSLALPSAELPLELPRPRRMLPYSVAAIVFLILMTAFLMNKPKAARLAISTPVPVAVPTPIRVEPTPVPTPAPPSRMELANAALKKALALEAGQDNRAALAAWLALAKDYSELKPGKNGLESLIQRFRNRPGGLPRAEFDAMRGDITSAAKLDTLSAMMLLGEQLKLSDPPASLEWFSAAADKHHDPEAMTAMAYLLSNGVGPGANPEQVVHYLNKAVEKEEPNAMMALGQLYLSGDFGVEKDEARAITLLQAAAAKGNSRAMNTLGDCYHRGIGVKRDYAEAWRLFSEAEKNGSAEASGNLGVMYLRGHGVSKKDPQRAAQKFKEASEKGDAAGMYSYAICLEDGIGVPGNFESAKAMYLRAAAGGQKDAIGWCKVHGFDVPAPK